MSKITKSNTKDEILEALTEAKEEHGVLHIEVESLQRKVEGLETLVQEDGVKKQGLIKELAAQSSDIELAKKKSEKYVEIKENFKSANKELEMVKGKLLAANKKVELLTTELESFKNRALPSGIKKGFRRFFNFKKVAVVGTILFVAIIAFGAIYMAVPHDNAFMDKIDKFISRVQHNVPIEVINPLASMTFTKTDSIVTARHDEETTLQTKDGILIDDSVILKWASTAGFDGVLFGTVTDLNGTVEISEININHVALRFKELGCINVLALVENRDELTLPGIFSQTSNGKLEVFESRRKLAGFVPVFWGKEKKQMNIKSNNVYAYITSDEIFMEVKGIKASVKLDIVKEDDSSIK